MPSLSTINSTIFSSKRGSLYLLLWASMAALALWNFAYLAEYVSAFNERRQVIYPSAFTFLSILWAADLTIWGLLKSRATRYIERLYDNVVFKKFVLQMELRIIYGFLVIVFSFSVYIADLMFGASIDQGSVVLVIWVFSYIAAVALIFESLLTARVVLD